MDAAAHHVIHDVIAAGNRIEHPADKPGFCRTLDGLKAKIYGVILRHARRVRGGGIIAFSVL